MQKDTKNVAVNPAINPTFEPELQRIIAAWPNLPEDIKQAIKALVNTHNKETK
jgi:hypothetical protein